MSRLTKLHVQLIRLDVLESDVACGYGNITLDGQSLHQDENGSGSGSITTEHGHLISANWKFTCVEEDGRHEQLMKFDVVYVDDRRVLDAGFTVQFRQVAPVQITHLDGAKYEASVPGTASSSEDAGHPSAPASLEDELAILEMMRLQLILLEQAIAEKEQYLAETFNHREASEEGSDDALSQCDSLSCVVRTIFKDVKGMANKVYAQDWETTQTSEHEKRPLAFDVEHGSAHHALHDSPLHNEPSHELPDDIQAELQGQSQEADGDVGVVS